MAVHIGLQACIHLLLVRPFVIHLSQILLQDLCFLSFFLFLHFHSPVRHLIFGIHEMRVLLCLGFLFGCFAVNGCFRGFRLHLVQVSLLLFVHALNSELLGFLHVTPCELKCSLRLPFCVGFWIVRFRFIFDLLHFFFSCGLLRISRRGIGGLLLGRLLHVLHDVLIPQFSVGVLSLSRRLRSSCRRSRPALGLSSLLRLGFSNLLLGLSSRCFGLLG